jgi:hypothetical protein
VACEMHTLLKVRVLALLWPVVLLTGCDSHAPPSKDGPAAAAVPGGSPASSTKLAAPPGELHVVSIQRGSYPPGTDDRPWWAKCKDDPSISESECHKKFASLQTKGQTEVAVTYTAAPVILALLGSDPVEWTIDVAPGVVLQKVILAGQYRQELKGLPPRVPVEVYNRESYGCETCTQAGPGFHGHDPNTGEYRQAMQRLRTVAGPAPCIPSGQFRRQPVYGSCDGEALYGTSARIPSLGDPIAQRRVAVMCRPGAFLLLCQRSVLALAASTRCRPASNGRIGASLCAFAPPMNLLLVSRLRQ